MVHALHALAHVVVEGPERWELLRAVLKTHKDDMDTLPEVSGGADATLSVHHASEAPVSAYLCRLSHL
jgi:hypothetical protein